MIDELSDAQAETALRRIDALRDDPFVRYVDAAPPEDEPVSSKEEAAVAEANAELARDTQAIPFDEIMREYG